MIWRNLWAFWGLAAVAVPVLIHLLGRERARVQKFPSLRFLDVSRVVPTRRRRLKDVLLLVVRGAIVAAAAFALAQPLLLTAGRTSAIGASLTRAIIVDTSASMSRPSPTGEVAVAAARNAARRLTVDAERTVTVETAAPANAIAGAVAWLATQPGRHEIAIVSDFQQGALDPATLAAIPVSVGVKLARVDVKADSSPVELRKSLDGAELVTRISWRAGRTDVEWTARESAARSNSTSDPLTFVTAPGDESRAEAARHAARSLGAPTVTDTGRRVAIVYQRAPSIAALVKSAKAPAKPWMIDVAARLRNDPVLADAVAAAATPASNRPRLDPFLVIARGADGRPLIAAGEDAADGRPRLVLFCLADPGSLTSAALIAAIDRATDRRSAIAELEPATIPSETLRGWERAPAAAGMTRANVANDQSDGRWIWAVVLILLAAEAMLRRGSRATPAEVPVAHDDRSPEREGHERVA